MTAVSRADTVTDSDMSDISSGFKTRLEYVLDQICVEAPDGGSHEMRRFIAEKLIAAPCQRPTRLSPIRFST